MIIFETPQSSRVKMKVTLERQEAGLESTDLDELKLLNPYSLLVNIPSKYFVQSISYYINSRNSKFYSLWKKPCDKNEFHTLFVILLNKEPYLIN